MPSSPLHHRPSPRRPTVGRSPSGADRGGAPPPRPPRPPWSPESQDGPARPNRRPGGFSPAGPGRTPPRRRRISRPVWVAAALAAAGLAAFGVGRSLLNGWAPPVATTEEAVESESQAALPRSEPTATPEPEPESSSELPLSRPEPSPPPPEPSADPFPQPEAEPLAAAPSAQISADWGALALSIVLVSANDCGWEGSGSIVDDSGHVLTNAHVVQDDYGSQCSDLRVWFTDSFDREPAEWVPARFVDADPVHDLALLRLTGRPVRGREPVRIDPRRLDPGELITVLGYPGNGGLRMTLTQGVYSGVMDDGDYIKTDADLAEGNSGGAAFDSSGAFIGVPTGGRGEVGLVIPAAAAERFLQQTLTAS